MDVILGLALSTHIGFNNSYNYIHPHIRLQEENLVAGVYYNSIEKISLYIGYEYDYKDFMFEFGTVSGYFKETPVIPYFRMGYKDIFVSPSIIGDDTGIVAGYELKF